MSSFKEQKHEQKDALEQQDTENQNAGKEENVQDIVTNETGFEIQNHNLLSIKNQDEKIEKDIEQENPEKNQNKTKKQSLLSSYKDGFAFLIKYPYLFMMCFFKGSFWIVCFSFFLF